MASLELAFSDLYTKVAEFLGLGSSPTGTDLTLCKNLVYRGYRKFLFPLEMNPRTGIRKTYVWSFRRQQGTLITEGDKWIYELPTDYAYIAGKLKFAAGENYPNPEIRSESQIIGMRTADNTTGYPRFYAIRAGKYYKDTGQTYEIILWPTADSAYTYLYPYVVNPPKPSADTDVFMGGVMASECILEHCLAVAETQEDDTIGIHTQLANELTIQLIQQDKMNHPVELGYCPDNSIYPSWSGIGRPPWRISDVEPDV